MVRAKRRQASPPANPNGPAPIFQQRRDGPFRQAVSDGIVDDIAAPDATDAAPGAVADPQAPIRRTRQCRNGSARERRFPTRAPGDELKSVEPDETGAGPQPQVPVKILRHRQDVAGRQPFFCRPCRERVVVEGGLGAQDPSRPRSDEQAERERVNAPSRLLHAMFTNGCVGKHGHVDWTATGQQLNDALKKKRGRQAAP